MLATSLVQSVWNNVDVGGTLDINAANISTTSAQVITATDVNLVTTGDTILSGANLLAGTVTANVGGNFTLNQDVAQATTLGVVTVGGDWNVDSDAGVTQSGALTVTGAATIDVATNAVNLGTDFAVTALTSKVPSH